MTHINQFPAYESHYTRRRTSKKYLQSDLNISLMYKLYSSTYTNPVSITKYAEVFRGTGLKFKKPKSDTCSKCDNLKMKISLAKNDDERNNLIEMQSFHHEDADFAFISKEDDKKLSKSNSNVKVYSFDLQQCLPTPLLRSNVSFYKRQLWTYNLTVHNCVTNEAFCYMWHEGIAKRGGNEISSCLFRHLMGESPGIEHIILYSDCCAGQNKNSFVATMFTTFLQNSNNIKIIDHKFLVSGHTHMECDVDHSIIERKKKKSNVQIHHPREWYQFVRSAGSTRNFDVIEMEQNNMIDFAKVLKTKCMWRKVNNDGEQFKWAEVKWLRFNGDFGKIQYKNTLKEDEPFKVLNIRRRGIPTIEMSNLPKCYDGPLAINPAKKKDLIDQFPLINEIYHNFYLNLNDGDVPNIDPDLFDEDDPETEDVEIPNN